MKKQTIAGIVVAIALATAGMPAQARGTNSKRVVEAPYKSPVIGASIEGQTTAYFYDCLSQIGCSIIKLQRRDRFATLEIKDSAGGPVFGSFYLMPGGNHAGEFCGETDLILNGATEILVHVISGVCPGGTPSVATTGVVQATLSRRP